MKHLADSFWNFRGSFKVAKVFDVGTHMSLVRKADGRFILIDSYAVSGDDREALMSLTDKGFAIDTIINVHPFHTLHCTAAHELAPHARLFGTRRHRSHAPELPWEDEVIEDPATQARFDDLDFSVPAGLDLVTADDSVHASSVLVRHRDSEIVHVDDTLMVSKPPGCWVISCPSRACAFIQCSPRRYSSVPVPPTIFRRGPRLWPANGR